MFNQLLSNLPYNPSLINELSFYARRVRREQAVRRLGVVFVVLAVVVQLFAVIAPPQPSLANSSNDIIFGGIGTTDPKGTLNKALVNGDIAGHHDIQNIYGNFNISTADIDGSTMTTINSSDHTLYSLGRNPGPQPLLDKPVTIAGVTYYLRPLYVWGDNLTYDALVGNRASPPSGQTAFFASMADCGNIVIRFGTTPKPELSRPVKTNIAGTGLPADNATVSPGQTMAYRIFWNNNGTGAATNVTVIDHIPTNTTYVQHGTGAANNNGGQLSGNQLIWQWNSMPAGAQNWYVDLWVKVNSNVPAGTVICNTAFLGSAQNSQQESLPVCHTVVITSKPLPPPEKSIPTPGQPNVTRSKLVSNLTKGQSNADNTTAAPKDILYYQLLTVNSGTATAIKYNIEDTVNDILEYAIITEISDGGQLKDGKITWPALDVKAKQTVNRSFKIQVKDTIPATPQSKSDPQSYDLQMDNVYGNKVSVKVASPSIPKTVETTTTTLVNTGPGTTLTIGFLVTLFIGYFFARSRLFAHELEIVRTEYATSGGTQ